MALLWIDGFEGYGTTDDAIPAPTGVLRRRYTETSDGSSSSYTQIKAGRFGGHGLWLSNDRIYTPTLTTDDTLIVGFAFKITDIYNTAMLGFFTTDLAGQFYVNVVGTELEVERGGTILGTTSGLGLVIDTWYWLELKVKCHDSTGTYELRIGETDVLSASGVDTKEGTNDYSVIRLGTTGTVLDIEYDDFYVCDSTGSTNNDFLGNCAVTAIRPNGAGYQDELTPSAGVNYQNVDEDELDDDTSYNESGVIGEKDTYNYDNVSGLEEVFGIQINTECRETDAESFKLKTVTRISSTDYTDSEQTIATSDFTNKRSISELNPNTSLAWTVTTLNLAEFGVEVA